MQNPIMWIFGLIYFVFAIILFTYHASMTYTPIFEIGPKLWILTFNLIRFSFVIAMLTLYGLMLLKQNYICSVLLIPLSIFVMVYTGRIKRKFSAILNSASLMAAKRKDQEVQRLDGAQFLGMDEKELENIYLPPVMRVKYKERQQYYQLQN